MIQEQKELLLKDLSARVPYGVKYMRYSWNYETDQELPVIETLNYIDKDGYIGHTKVYTVEDIKPCLFPLSSMTEEQKKEYDSIIYSSIELHCERYYDVIDIDEFEVLMDFYHKYHFDYRGLIPMGLARDASGLKLY